MAKGSILGTDPCTPFFWNDWQGGTMTLSRFQKGCYMDLLTAQFNNGHLSLEEIKNVLGNDFAAWQGVLSKKFKQDQEGKFYNVRLEQEILKRKAYSASRRKNASVPMLQHMGNGIGDGIDNDLDKRKSAFFEKVNSFESYSSAMRHEFYEYWTEKSDGAKLMRFEKQAAFEISKRLKTWERNQHKFTFKESSSNVKPNKSDERHAAIREFNNGQ